jgi:hypothetical protein
MPLVFRLAETADVPALEKLVTTLAGVPLSMNCGYVVVSRDDLALPNGATLPVARMRKARTNFPAVADRLGTKTSARWTGYSLR